jgi:hypothetical protein
MSDDSSDAALLLALAPAGERSPAPSTEIHRILKEAMACGILSQVSVSS